MLKCRTLSLSLSQRGARILSYERSELRLFGLIYGGSVKINIELGLDLSKNK